MPAESEVPVLGTRRRLTPEYRRDVASLVLDTGSTNRVCGDGGFAPLEALPRRVAPLMLQFPPFGGALDVGRARPRVSHGAFSPVC